MGRYSSSDTVQGHLQRVQQGKRSVVVNGSEQINERKQTDLRHVCGEHSSWRQQQTFSRQLVSFLLTVTRLFLDIVVVSDPEPRCFDINPPHWLSVMSPC